MTQWEYSESGTTLRDQFAMAALQGFLASDEDWRMLEVNDDNRRMVCRDAYQWADAMMQARETNKGKDNQ